MDYIHSIEELNVKQHGIAATAIVSAHEAAIAIRHKIECYLQYSKSTGTCPLAFGVKFEPSSWYEKDGHTKCPGEQFYAVWAWYLQEDKGRDEMQSAWDASGHYAENVFMIGASILVAHQKEGQKLVHQYGDIVVLGVGDASDSRKKVNRIDYTNNGTYGRITLPVLAKTIQAIEDCQRLIEIQDRIKIMFPEVK